MQGASIVRWSFLGVGILLVILNAFHLTAGFVRVRHALDAQPIPPRFADALQTAWLYLGSMGLAFGVILCWCASDAAAGSIVAWKIGMTIGVALIATGVAAYLATGKHPGLLFLSVLGVVILIPLILRNAGAPGGR